MVNNKKMTGFNEFSILLIPIVWMFCNAAIAPALGSIAQHFPGASDFELKMVLAITSITSVAFSIISGKLAKFIDSKILVMIGLAIYGLGGICTTLCITINQVLILRLVTGVGVGLVLPLPGAIISENFDGEKRSRLLGLCTSTTNISNVVISILAGILSVYGWEYPFYTFAFSFVLVLTTLVGVPKASPVEVETEVNAHVPKEKLSGSIYLLASFMILAWMTHVTLTSNLALFWMREKVGAQAMVGLVLSLSGLASIVVGAMYPELKRLFKKYFTFITLLAFGLGFAFMYYANSIPAVFAGCLLEGAGFGLIMSLIMDATAEKSKDSQKSAAFGLVSGAMHLGGFLSPIIQVAYATIGNNSSIRFLFLVAAVEVAVAAIVAILAAIKMKSNITVAKI
jgi:MFS family permease